MSQQAQRAFIWWSVAMMVAYGLILGLLLHMIPPPRATLPSADIATWYADRSTSIRIGATLASYVSGFMVPLSIVVAVQIARVEGGRRVWAYLAAAGGTMMSTFLVLPPLFWGVAAFTTTRDPQATALMHELGTLTLVTTDQYYIFMWVAIVVICFKQAAVPHSPFPRWMGWYTAWIALMFEAGAVAFMTKTGPFAWNGVLVYWFPLSLFGAWLTVMVTLLLKSITRQGDTLAATGEIDAFSPAVA